MLFISNAPYPNFIVAKNLKKWGLSNVSLDKVITSGDVARCIIQKKYMPVDKKNPTVYHLGKDRNNSILTKINHKATDNINEADTLLMSLYRDEDENINEFDQFLMDIAQKNNIHVICANPDTTILKNGIIRYCAGYFANIIKNFGGIVTYTGKPNTIIFNRAFTQYNYSKISRDRILMVGDTLETDILGANKVGINSALVMTGNASRLFHNKPNTLEDRLAQLINITEKVNIIPTFVTKLI